MRARNNVWGLYVVTALIDALPALARFALASVIVWIIAVVRYGFAVGPYILGLSSLWPQAIDNPTVRSQVYWINVVGTVVATLFACYPFILSAAALMLPSSGYLRDRLSYGAREASPRENGVIQTALADIADQAGQQVPHFGAVFVVDDVKLSAFTLGTTLYVTRELVKSPYLTPLLARELGHLAYDDGRTQLALRSLSISWLQLVPGIEVAATARMAGQALRGNAASRIIIGGVQAFHLLTWASRGGLGTYLMRLPWNLYWQEQEYAADRFAAQCGYTQALIEYLEKFEAFDIAAPFYNSDKPYTEQRIARLQTYLEDPSVLTATPLAATPATGSMAVGRTIAGIVVAIAVIGVIGYVFAAIRPTSPDTIQGSWRLIRFCRSNGCTPTDGPVYGDIIMMSIDPMNLHDNSILISSYNGEYGSSFRGTYNIFGKSLHITQIEQQPGMPIDIFLDYDMHFLTDSLVLRTSTGAWEWRRLELYAQHLEQVRGNWKRTDSGYELSIGVKDDASMQHNNEDVGRFTVLDNTHLHVYMKDKTIPETYTYTVTGNVLTLHGAGDGDLNGEYTRQSGP